ncbi:MAG: hypothetical protein IJ774_00305 [Selenomonadaceae bacterium]|nr:hypothetical protein [Selenomonadaceae bacterium]
MIRICERCGTQFDETHFAKYCPACRPIVKNTRLPERIKLNQAVIRNRVDEAQGKTVKTISDWAREADECNLDYGTYRALIAAGRTFEQLKAEHRSPQPHSHCRRHIYDF